MPEIYGTLGPACADAAILEQMLHLGMTGVRLNLSHVTLLEAEGELEALTLAAQRVGVRPKLLIDMQGPELRVGALCEPLRLTEGELVPLAALSLPEIVTRELTEGMELLLDDGKLLVRLEGEPNALCGRVLHGGLLRGRKSVAVPGLNVSLPALTEADRRNLRAAASYGVTGLMQPFVRSREDLEAVRAAMAEAGCPNLRLFAKIENRTGLEKLPELIGTADEIVIARGDLGNAVPLWALPRVQKEIAAACRKAGRPFMVVTQMLASMEHSPVPTRAEVSDIFNAVLDGATSVMVTGETAAGEYPVEVLRYLSSTVREAENYLNHRKEQTT